MDVVLSSSVARRFVARSQVLLYGVARLACTPGYLADGLLLAQAGESPRILTIRVSVS